MRSSTLKTTIHFEGNALSRLAKLEYKKVFIIADPFIVSSGLIKAVTKHLDSAGIEYKVYSDVVPDPTVEKVVSGVAALSKEMAPCLIAVGGGSAIDLAKCVRLFTHNIHPDYSPRFIAIPTTSGTGSEVTSFAVITDTSKNVKHAIIDDFLLPNEAILDVEMVKSVPASVTADTGLDVLAHALEAYVSTEADYFTDMYAEKATSLCKHYLVRSYNYPKTHENKARDKMHVASCLAGIAFNAASLGICHSIAHQLGAQFHIPHGRANAIVLPDVIGFNSGIAENTFKLDNPGPCVSKYANMSRRIGLAGYDDIACVKALAFYIRSMQIEMGMPVCVQDAVPNLTYEEYESKLDAMAAAALLDRCTGTNPRKPTKEDIIQILKKVWK
ncbi:MAG: iron-containing alcohol dehydrogenase [Clostridia bacterium]|nr:iron-containing alcohol dehydrogenase [Clostridia bacterium]MBQ7907800.1 iron-containing alcohol dehydrogenase [Clostridia bacterium]